MTEFHPGDCHAFDAAGRRFVYLAPSAAVLAIDGVSAAVLDAVAEQPRSRDELVSELSGRFTRAEVEEAALELARVRALRVSTVPPPRQARVLPLTPIPLSTMVLNVTSQCNLSCAYCYEYGEDKIVETANGRLPKWMSEETARESVDFLLRESGPSAHLTFFGGETLMNFRVLKTAVAYAKDRAAALGKEIDFSLTTNATLLKDEIIDFLAEHRFGVTISIDGPPDLQNKFRVFKGGAGSYDVAVPKIRELLKRHRSRPIGARVTLTRETLDVRRIFDHLANEIGFWEVGFAPVTSAPGRSYSFGEEGFEDVLAAFRDLAQDYLDGRACQPPSRLQQRSRDARGDSQRREQGMAVRRRIRAARRLDRRRRRPLSPLCGFGRPQARHGARRHRSRRATHVSRDASRRPQDGLPDVLGASALRGRLLPRGPHAPGQHGSPQSSLLRMDSRLDGYLSSHLRRNRREEPGVSKAVRGSHP